MALLMTMELPPQIRMAQRIGATRTCLEQKIPGVREALGARRKVKMAGQGCHQHQVRQSPHDSLATTWHKHGKALATSHATECVRTSPDYSFPTVFGAGGLVWEELAPAKVAGLGKEDRKNQKSAPKKPALKIKILGYVRETCPSPSGAGAVDIKWASLGSCHQAHAHHPGVSMSLKCCQPQNSSLPFGTRKLQQLPPRCLAGLCHSACLALPALCPNTLVMQSPVLHHSQSPTASSQGIH